MILPVCNIMYNHFHTQKKKESAFFFLCRPAFLPDPNDGSLYSLGGKNNEGLTVSEQAREMTLPFSEESSNL